MEKKNQKRKNYFGNKVWTHILYITFPKLGKCELL